MRHGFCDISVVIVQQNAVLRAPPERIDKLTDREQGSEFLPKFDSAGLLSAVVQDSLSGDVLMVAFMDREALERTRTTGLAHFRSRSRGRLWMKGETSGHTLAVERILVDCDQDALVLKVRPNGPACHTGARSCFYRELTAEGLAGLAD
jgi:phosphoribosyl-AMP cyclohydrolase